ncbi:MAG: sigma-70 family RNA polymerase sigma factor [Solirubrobacteraceae bacterium]|nr:sigma-70 family RNA polymerase sigma factor [Solirubrobacteraceae bacterium]
MLLMRCSIETAPESHPRRAWASPERAAMRKHHFRGTLAVLSAHSTFDSAASLRAAANGDAAAWRWIVDRYSRLVWATVRGHRLADADAADVVQTTWLRLVESLGRIDDPDRLGAWLVTTARREALRVIASSARTVPTDDHGELPDPQRPLEHRLLVHERDTLLREALARLPESQQLLLRLLAADPPATYEEISIALDMPIGSIGPLRRRYLDRLRNELAASGITEAQ